MRIFYFDEGPIDTLLQLSAKPVWDGDLISKTARDAFMRLGWVARCEGWNIITHAGHQVVSTLCLLRTGVADDSLVFEKAREALQPFAEVADWPLSGVNVDDITVICKVIKKSDGRDVSPLAVFTFDPRDFFNAREALEKPLAKEPSDGSP